MKPITTSSEKDVFHLILKLAKTLRCFQDDSTFCENITFTQFTVLDFVAGADGKLPLSELHDLLGVEKSTTTRLVAPLLKMGLATKERSTEDRRAFDIAMTTEGERVHGSVWECLSGYIREMMGTLPPAEVEETMRVLGRFTRTLDHCCKEYL